MARPWETVDSAKVDEGTMTLMRRGDEYLIKMDTYVLMNSKLNLTELALAQSACEELAHIESPRVLIGGLGMGYTLRAALDALPKAAQVTVAELNPVVVGWCKGVIAELTDSAAADPRVAIRIDDVAQVIREGAQSNQKYDGIILDLYQGTFEANTNPNDPFYGKTALSRTAAALAPGGVLSVWTEETDVRFEKRLTSLGFNVRRTKPGKGGPRHVVYLAKTN